MARAKSMETEDIIKCLQEYRFENPQIKIKIPELANYLRSKGYDIKDYTLRRNTEFREYLKAINNCAEEKMVSDLVTYKTLDADEFLAKNNTKDKLKKALITREQYYASVAASAVEAINKRKAIEQKNNELKKQLELLAQQNNENKDKEYKAQLKEKDEAIRVLKEILETYIYPDAANALLEQAGVYEVVSKIIPTEKMKEKTIQADTNINVSKYESVNNLIGEFEDE